MNIVANQKWTILYEIHKIVTNDPRKTAFTKFWMTTERSYLTWHHNKFNLISSATHILCDSDNDIK